jgi:hypothetical protein
MAKVYKSQSEKNKRNSELDNFISKYGSGNLGLTEEQIKSRKEKLIGKINLNKYINYGDNPNDGLVLFNSKIMSDFINQRYERDMDYIPDDIIQNISSYPKDIRAIDKDWRLIGVDIKADGSACLTLILFDGHAMNRMRRKIMSVSFVSDKKLNKIIISQYNEGKLKEVSDRVLSILKDQDEALYNKLLESSDIDTDEDKEGQY